MSEQEGLKDAILRIAKRKGINDSVITDLVEAKWKALIEAERELKSKS